MRVKRIFVFFLATVVLTTTSGFAMHFIRCQMTGDTYHSVAEKCCCAAQQEEKAAKCCEQESMILKVDTQAAIKEFNFNINPVFLAAFTVAYIELDFSSVHKVDYLTYLKHFPPLPEQEIIIFVQSFLL
jgi:hypothetical protein